MAHLNLSVYLEILDPETGESVIKLLREYKKSSDKISQTLLDSLYEGIRSVKGEWVYIHSNHYNDAFYSDLILTFLNANLTDADNALLEKVFIFIDKYIEETDLGELNKDFDNLDKYSESFSKGGFIVGLREDTGLLDYEDIESVLNNNGITFEKIGAAKTEVSCGAGNVAESVFYFISGAVASGLTWDIIKTMFTAGLANPVENILVQRVENRNFKRIRRLISERVRVSVGDMVLRDMSNDDSGITMKFGALNKVITVIIDQKNLIKSVVVEDVFKGF